MEFEFTIHGFGATYISAWDAESIKRLSQEDQTHLRNLLDVFGKRSAKAQGLGAPVTDIYRLRSTDQRLYLAATREPGKTTVLGGLKVGKKKLFLQTPHNKLQEVEPVCVLDFYVHESYQRQGLGKKLFQHFLEAECLTPGAVGYDRPSPKLLAFLGKHYGLHDYLNQSNNFVVFNVFWQHAHKIASKGTRGHHAQHGRRATPDTQASQRADQGSLLPVMTGAKVAAPQPVIQHEHSSHGQQHVSAVHDCGPHHVTYSPPLVSKWSHHDSEQQPDRTSFHMPHGTNPFSHQTSQQVMNNGGVMSEHAHHAQHSSRDMYHAAAGLSAVGGTQYQDRVDAGSHYQQPHSLIPDTDMDMPGDHGMAPPAGNIHDFGCPPALHHSYTVGSMIGQAPSQEFSAGTTRQTHAELRHSDSLDRFRQESAGQAGSLSTSQKFSQQQSQQGTPRQSAVTDSFKNVYGQSTGVIQTSDGPAHLYKAAPAPFSLTAFDQQQSQFKAGPAPPTDALGPAGGTYQRNVYPESHPISSTSQAMYHTTSVPEAASAGMPSGSGSYSRRMSSQSQQPHPLGNNTQWSQPPWGVEGQHPLQLQASHQIPAQRGAYPVHSANLESSHRTEPRPTNGSSYNMITAGDHVHQYANTDYSGSKPPLQAQYNQQQQRQQSQNSTAKTAALAARSGSGAAACLHW